MSNAERRAVSTGEREVVPRIADVYAAVPAITGKLELEYEGELVGGNVIARELIRRASDATFKMRAGGVNTDDVVMWFDAGGALQVSDDVSADAVYKGFENVPGLAEVVRSVGLARNGDTAVGAAACELVLESLVARKKISRTPDWRLRGCPSAAQLLPISTPWSRYGWHCFVRNARVPPTAVCAPGWPGGPMRCTAHSWNRPPR